MFDWCASGLTGTLEHTADCRAVQAQPDPAVANGHYHNMTAVPDRLLCFICFVMWNLGTMKVYAPKTNSEISGQISRGK